MRFISKNLSQNLFLSIIAGVASLFVFALLFQLWKVDFSLPFLDIITILYFICLL